MIYMPNCGINMSQTAEQTSYYLHNASPIPACCPCKASYFCWQPQLLFRYSLRKSTQACFEEFWSSSSTSKASCSPNRDFFSDLWPGGGLHKGCPSFSAMFSCAQVQLLQQNSLWDRITINHLAFSWHGSSHFQGLYTAEAMEGPDRSYSTL
jgi:hypothetical protein